MDIKTMVLDYLPYLKMRRISDKTKSAYEYELLRFSDYHTDSEISLDSIYRTFDRMRTSGIIVTNRTIYAVKDFLKYWDMDRIAKKIIPLGESENKHNVRIARKDVVDKLIDHAPTLQDRVIVSMLYGYALRISELSNIVVDDIDTKNNSIVIHTSKKRGNKNAIDEMPLLRSVSIHLIPYIKKRRDVGIDNQALFLKRTSDDKLIPMEIPHLRYRLKVLCRYAGLDYYNPHAFRHGRVTDLRSNGVPENVILLITRQSAVWIEGSDGHGGYGQSALLEYEHLTVDDKRKLFEKWGIE